MKHAHRVELSVFVHQGEDAEKIKKTLIALVHLDFEKEKLAVKEQKAAGFQKKQILIFSIIISKEKHINVFLEALLNRLTKEQKKQLSIQKAGWMKN